MEDKERIRRSCLNIIKVTSLLYQKGLIAGADGNVSLRLSTEGPVLITPSGCHKGLLTPEDILTVGLDGEVINGNGRPSSELWMHLFIYSRIPEAMAIVHAHPPWTLALDLAGLNPSQHVLAEGYHFLGKIPVVGFYPPGSKDLANKVANVATNAKVIVLEQHGAVTWARTLESALCLMESLEHESKVMVITQAIAPQPEKLQEKIHRIRSALEGL